MVIKKIKVNHSVPGEIIPSAVRDDSDSILNIGDENGNVLVEFKDGHIKTENFDSRTTAHNIRVEHKKLILA